MPTFKELMDMLTTPPEDGLPEDFANQLQSAYDHDIQEYTDSAATALENARLATERAQAADAAKLEIQKHNARLLKSIPANKPEDDDPADDHNTDPFESNVTIESMTEYI